MDIFNLESISPILKEPTNKADFDLWIQQADIIPFLEREIIDENIIIYAGLPFAFIHAVLIPNVDVDNSVVEDLLAWNQNPYSTWSVVVSSDNAWIEGPLEGSRSEVLSKGEQIVFARTFDGVEAHERYFELDQKISQVLELHYMSERNAWCRLDQHGDVEEIVKVIKIENLPERETGTIVTMNKNLLGEFTSLTNLLLCRMYDFTRYKRGSFSGWGNSKSPIRVGNSSNIFSDLVVYKGYGSYSRGIQVNNINIPKEEIINRVWGRPSYEESKQYASFIALDWKNNRIAEISCAPSSLANYFTQSDLPFELTPAFFRPEVLLKYKSDREKYQLEDRSISCRGTWYLETFDINEAGQIHTYLGYLNRLPYEEQLHWKQYNEEPKASLSKRAYATDFEGRWIDGYDALYSLKNKLRQLHKAGVSWWTLRSEATLERVLYPFTSSHDEWADEILNLDQLVIEGFEEKWLQRKARDLGRNPDVKLRALKSLEECLIGVGFEEDHAHDLMSPFHDVHNLRSIIKGHTSGREATEVRKKALQEFGSLRQHFTDLCAKCDESLGVIMEAFHEFK